MDGKENCPNIHPGFAAEETPMTGRGRKGGGSNLRKSLAWNSAFFTDEGVLDSSELTMLSGRSVKPGGKSAHDLDAKEGGSTLYSKSHTTSHTNDRNLSRLGSETDFRSFLTPMANILEESSSKTNRNSSLRPTANSQKRVANASTTEEASKFQKLKTRNCPLPKSLDDIHQSTKGLQHAQNFPPVRILRTEGPITTSVDASKAAPLSTNSLTDDSALLLKKHDRSGTFIPRPALPMNSKASAVMTISRFPALCSPPSSNVTQTQSTASHSKPSALRMPSPSLGFFVQGKTQISSQMSGKKCIGSTADSDKQSVRAANIKKYASQDKNMQISGGKPPIAASTANAREAGTNCIKGVLMDIQSGQSGETSSQNCQVKSTLELNLLKTKITDSSISQSLKLPVSIQKSEHIAANKNMGKLDEIIAAEINSNETIYTKYMVVNENTDKSDQSVVPEMSSNETLLYTNTAKPQSSQGTSDGNDVNGSSSISANFVGLRTSGFLTSCESCFPERPRDCSMYVKNVVIDDPNPDKVEASAVGSIVHSDFHWPDSVDQRSNENLGSTPLIVDMCSSIQAGIPKSTATSEEMKNIPSPVKDMSVDVSKRDPLPLRTHLNAMPFTDEWIAAAEAFGEDILKMKTGAVQNSPKEKSLPEPSPWSPVKKTHNVGPFDCTKLTKGAPSLSEA